MYGSEKVKFVPKVCHGPRTEPFGDDPDPDYVAVVSD